LDLETFWSHFLTCLVKSCKRTSPLTSIPKSS